MFLALVSASEEFWNTLLFGNGGWLYIILIYGIVFLISLRFKWFGFFGVLFAIFSVFSLIEYGNANTFTLELIYRIAVHCVASLMLGLVISGLLRD